MEESLAFVDYIRLGGLLPALLLLVGTWVAVRFATGAIERVGKRFTDRRLMLQQASTVVRFVLYFVGVLSALGLAFQWSREMLLAVGGTLAVALGFALKDVAASVLSGLMVLTDRPFQVGDRVTIAGYYGEVVQIGLRSIRLVTLDDNLVTIPNNRLLTEPVSSANAGALDMMVQMDFYIGIDQDMDLAKEVVRDGLTSSRYAYIGKPWTVLVNEVVHETYFAVRLRAKAYVLDVRYEKAFETDVTERVLRGFRKNDIAPPAIHERTVYSRVPPSRDPKAA